MTWLKYEFNFQATQAFGKPYSLDIRADFQMIRTIQEWNALGGVVVGSASLYFIWPSL